MKQIINKIGLLIVIALSTVFSAVAYDFEVDGIYYSILEDKTSVEVTNNGNRLPNSYIGDVIIPSQVTFSRVTYDVISIGKSAFLSCSSLTDVSIPNSVTSIDIDAFHYCSGLISIEIPNSVTSIGDWAFSDCSSLTSIEIPNSVTSIGYGAFYHCSSLNSVKLPDSVTSIGENTFAGCSGLSSIKLPDSVTSIGAGWFSGCSSLTSIEIPNSVTSIGKIAFRNCSSLTSIEIPNSVTSIDEAAFRGCSSLTEIISLNTIPPSVKDYSSFDGLYDQATLYVPQDAVNAYQGAYGWENFTTIKVIDNFDGLTEPGYNDVAISVADGGIDILNATEMARVIVSGVDGRVVTAMYAEDAKLHIPLAAGIYIVKVGDAATAKVLVK